MLRPLTDQLKAALDGRYIVGKEIGRGGMATVFAAEDLKHRRKVALKVLRPELALSVGIERFSREIDIAAGLQHPHILPVHDSGRAGELFYYVMPFVDGGSLRDRLVREGQLSIDDAVTIASEVGGALFFAHQRRIVHRDIKPENILFQAGHAVVADFGIARAVDAAGVDALTGTGVSVGTPAYMSPEQIEGKADERSDIYSLACVLYEMLVGHPPFTGRTAQEILGRHSVDPVPSVRAARNVPVSLEQALHRGLAKQAIDRYADVEKFVDAVNEATRPRAQMEDVPTAPLPKKVEEVPPPPNSVAVLPFSDLSEQQNLEYFCDGMTEEVIAALTRAGTLRVASQRSVSRFKDLKRGIREVGRELNVGSVLEGSVRTAGDRLRVAVTLSDVSNGYQRWVERYDRSMVDLFAVQDEIAQSIVGALKISLSDRRGAPLVQRHTQSVEAYRLYLQGRHFWNKRLQGGLQKAIECFEQALEIDPMYARAYSGLADCFTALGFYEYLQPKVAFPRAIAASQKALELEPGIGEAHASFALATMYFHHDWGASESGFKRAIALEPEYSSAHQWYSIWLAAQGQMDAALVEGRRAQETDPLSLTVGTHLAWMQYLAGQNEPAIASCRTQLEMHPDFGITRGILGLAFVGAGRLDDGIAELIAASKVFPPAVGPLGHAYALAGNSAEARRLLQQLRQTSQERYVSAFAFALIHAGLHEDAQVFEALEQAYQERSTWIVLTSVHPMFAPLRKDRRFKALLKKVGLA